MGKNIAGSVAEQMLGQVIGDIVTYTLIALGVIAALLIGVVIIIIRRKRKPPRKRPAKKRKKPAKKKGAKGRK